MMVHAFYPYILIYRVCIRTKTFLDVHSLFFFFFTFRVTALEICTHTSQIFNGIQNSTEAAFL